MKRRSRKEKENVFNMNSLEVARFLIVCGESVGDPGVFTELG